MEHLSKSEINRVLEGKGDFVQIDYLTRFLKKGVSLDLKKFIYLKLAKIYEKKQMFEKAGKMFENVAIVSVTFSDKIKYYIEVAKSYVRAGDFESAGRATKKAMGEANSSEKLEVYNLVKEFYKTQARNYEQEGKRNHAVRVYEKFLRMNISEVEKEEVKAKLIELYERLGMFKEAGLLKISSKV